MAALVTLEVAKSHLRVSDVTADDDIQRKIEAASAIILDYLKVTDTSTWDADTVPGYVQMAVLLMLTHLHENRGDDMKSDEALWAAIRRLLERSRDPAYA